MPRKKKPKVLRRTHADQKQVPLDTAIQTLKDEIVSDVKDLSAAKMRSVYGLIQKGKELIELEKGVEDDEQVPAPTAKAEGEELTVNDI
jgi:hypothetical protein